MSLTILLKEFNHEELVSMIEDLTKQVQFAINAAVEKGVDRIELAEKVWLYGKELAETKMAARRGNGG